MTTRKPLKPFRKEWEEIIGTETADRYRARYAMLPAPIDVPKELRRHVGRVLRPGECHDYAAKYVLYHTEAPGIRMFYGTYLEGYRHSWVEIAGNIAFDGETQEFYPADEYRAAYRVAVLREYTAKEVARLIAREGHFGPWEGNYR